jgi:hypothetical protein
MANTRWHLRKELCDTGIVRKRGVCVFVAGRDLLKKIKNILIIPSVLFVPRIQELDAASIRMDKGITDWNSMQTI